MTPRSQALPRVTAIDEQIRRLAECDESLAELASDVSALLGELSSLRDDADQLYARLAEREELLASKTLELSTSESERVAATHRAAEAAAALADVERALHDDHSRAEPLEREVASLRDALAHRDLRLAKVEAELALAGSALVPEDADSSGPGHVARELDRETFDRPILHPAAAHVAQAHAESERALDRDRLELRTESRAHLLGHVVFAGFSDGYRLSYSNEPCPQPADVLEVDGRRFTVSRVGPSPLPSDERPCAFLVADFGDM